MGVALNRAHDDYCALRDAGVILVDMARIENAVIHGAGAEVLSESITEQLCYDGKGTAIATRAIIGAVLESCSTRPGRQPPRGVSTKAPADSKTRRASRVLAMIHELHKAGYQGFRFRSWSMPKDEWRIAIFAANNCAADGFTPLTNGLVVEYSTLQANAFFGWSDAKEDDARALAAKFVARFPTLATEAAIEDWAYAGWFCSILGDAEHGRLPILHDGEGLAVSPGALLPPGIPGAGKLASGTGHPLIANEDLRVSDIPKEGADYETLSNFALTYDGYANGMRTIADCIAIADEAEKVGLRGCTLDTLRITLFIRQRAAKDSVSWPPPVMLLHAMTATTTAIREHIKQVN